MDRRNFLVTAAAVAPMALAGCLGDSNDPTENGDDSVGRTITVGARGESSGEPDLAVLSLGVEVQADTAGQARSELAAGAEALVSALENDGVPEDAITTERFQIRERIDRAAAERDGIDPRGELPEEYRYYVGTHTYRVELESIDRVGDVIDTAVDAGANDIGRVTFTLSDAKRAELRQQALAEALETARTEAETIAENIGASIVEVTVVDSSDGRITPIERDIGDTAEMEAPESAPATTVDPGDVTVSVDIQVQYKIEG
jgi:uncharacterized protein YggE